MLTPKTIQLIGNEVAIRWSDGSEDFYLMEYLRARSPSAETTGERDLTGRVWGGSGNKDYTGVRVTAHQVIGGYAIQFHFSDGHRTGLFAYDYLKAIAQ